MMYTCESPEFWGCVTISPALLHTKALFWGVSVQVVNTWYAHSASLIGLIRKRTLFLQGSFVFWDSAAKEPYFWSIFPTYRHLTCTLGKPTRTLPQKNTYLAGLFCILELLHKRALFLEVFFQPIDTWYAHSASLLGLFHTRALFCLSSFASWDSSAKEPYFVWVLLHPGILRQKSPIFGSIFPTYRHLICTLKEPTDRTELNP